MPDDFHDSILDCPISSLFLMLVSFLFFFTSNTKLEGMGSSSNIFLAFSTVPHQTPYSLEIRSQVLLTWLGAAADSLESYGKKILGG